MSLNFETLTGFTYRGLTPHKFTPVPGVHPSLHPIAARWAAPGELFVMRIKQDKIKNLTEENMDDIVWRYLTFSKFISMLAFNALWFPKLKVLQDNFEGTLPQMAYQTIQNSHGKWEKHFPLEQHEQIDNMTNDNIDDGKELTLVNCWFYSPKECNKMWEEYVASTEGVAIKSTVNKLATYIGVEPEFSYLGQVKYVDFATYDQSGYLSNQATERAFLKSEHLAHEKEIRITTLSIKTPSCVSMEGKPYAQNELEGKKSNNFENDGLYIQIMFSKLVDEVVLAPNASKWFELTVKRIIEMSKLTHIPVKRSALENN